MTPGVVVVFTYLAFGIITGFVGFGDFFGVPESFNPTAFLPSPLYGVAVWLSRILFMPLILFFVVSILLGKNLHNRHY